MGCGIGVCFSCVCKLINNNYSRICIDGPIYKAKEIDWSEEK
jgi:dihydroorotate dehydrogenase electron transfer subunit